MNLFATHLPQVIGVIVGRAPRWFETSPVIMPVKNASLGAKYGSLVRP